jgi:hypothetical protein
MRGEKTKKICIACRKKLKNNESRVYVYLTNPDRDLWLCWDCYITLQLLTFKILFMIITGINLDELDKRKKW